MPDAPGGATDRPRHVPEVRHGARADRGHRRRREEPGTGGHVAPVLDLARAGGADPGGDGRGLHSGSASDARARASNRCVGPDDPRHADRPLGRSALLQARLGVDREPLPQHVHADCPGRRRGLQLQRRCDGRTWNLPALVSRSRSGRRLLRGIGGHRRAGPPRPGAGAARARPDELGDPGAPEACAPDCAPNHRRHGRRRRPRAGRRRRSPAGAARRTRAGRRCRRRRFDRYRRIDGYGRADSGRERTGREDHRRHA